MGRIGNFFKKVGRGIKSAFHKVINVAPKVIDAGKKAVNLISPAISGLPQNKITGGLNKAVNFTDNALNKADQLVKAQQTGGVKGMINAGVGMIKH